MVLKVLEVFISILSTLKYNEVETIQVVYKYCLFLDMGFWHGQLLFEVKPELAYKQYLKNFPTSLFPPFLWWLWNSGTARVDFIKIKAIMEAMSTVAVVHTNENSEPPL